MIGSGTSNLDQSALLVALVFDVKLSLKLLPLTLVFSAEETLSMGAVSFPAGLTDAVLMPVGVFLHLSNDVSPDKLAIREKSRGTFCSLVGSILSISNFDDDSESVAGCSSDVPKGTGRSLESKCTSISANKM